MKAYIPLGILIIYILLTSGCKGKQGDRGDMGPPGTGHFEFISGPVPSDDFTVTDARITESQQISVYLGDGTNWAQLNSYLPGVGKNTFYLVNIGQGKVEIFNAKTASAINYLVDVYLP